MKYIKYLPDISLQRHIAYYWILQTDATFTAVNVPLFADVDTDIFINFGSAEAKFNDHVSLSPGCVYMGGANTLSSFINSFPNSTFIGIKFKAGGLPIFYNLPLFEIVDQIIEFQDKQLYSILDLDELLPKRLDKFFITKKNKISNISSVTEVVHSYRNIMQVDLLAQKCNMSTRTMERAFNKTMGMGPKEFIAIVRFQKALKMLQKSRLNGKLMDVAFEAGYYDHAHLTREVKKYSGLTPSEIWPGPRFP
ncbi:helix-turn-helix transcriptional regulator [Mucilaginibacter sp. X4EP1]|jgi:AraC-like DNA-binding protein|uniref:helix-turn-helix transcriptional regulator n=1 Tax=Mucilaginibacter sp. X4EP1 TaxID=2723092 RepID=UPI0021682C76|nr:helix-turn-helix transcriptional regulator [Mucilaginibacter sp. X4EP1]MCS3812586.1 AraC-like DNA-binding protein [Mucilaginibacter sp. X4EP1]